MGTLSLCRLPGVIRIRYLALSVRRRCLKARCPGIRIIIRRFIARVLLSGQQETTHFQINNVLLGILAVVVRIRILCRRPKLVLMGRTRIRSAAASVLVEAILTLSLSRLMQLPICPRITLWRISCVFGRKLLHIRIPSRMSFRIHSISPHSHTFNPCGGYLHAHCHCCPRR